MSRWMSVTCWIRGHVAWAALSGILLLPASASGQGDVYGRIGIATTQVYDGNVNAAPEGQTRGDLISRIGPSLETGYRSTPLTIVARYAIDAERYMNHVELSRAIGRQDAGVELRYRPARRVDLTVDASYVATQTPGEFNLSSLLVAGRGRAARLAAASTVTYDWRAGSRMTAGAAFARHVLAGGLDSAAGTARLAFDRRGGPRTTYRAAYETEYVSFSNGVAQPSHALTGGWSHAVARETRIAVDGGPRFVHGGVRPEVSARLTRELPEGELAVGYARTQATAVGEAGTFEVHRTAATGTYRPARAVGFTAATELARSAQRGAAIVVRTLALEATVRLTRDIAVTASALRGTQVGTLAGSRQEIPYARLTLGLATSLPGIGGMARRRGL